MGRRIISYILMVIMCIGLLSGYSPNVEAKGYVKKLVVSKKKANVIEGKVKRISVKVKIKGKISKRIKVKSLNKKIAKVTVSKPNKKGRSIIKIKGIKEGKTTVVVKTKKKGKNNKYKKARIKVVVSAKDNKPDSGENDDKENDIDNSDDKKDTDENKDHNKDDNSGEDTKEPLEEYDVDQEYAASNDKCVIMISDTNKDCFAVNGLSDGYYKVTAMCTYDGKADHAFIYANGIVEKIDNEYKGFSGDGNLITSIPVSAKGKNVYIRGVQVTDGNLVLGSVKGYGNEGKLLVKVYSIEKEEIQKPNSFLYGATLSRLNYVEDTGALFYDDEGVQINPVKYMSQNGINFCRLELYNHPGKGRGDGSYYCPDGYQNKEDMLEIAERAKLEGIDIELSFMLSDFWTVGIPDDFAKDIAGETDEDRIVDILEEDIYEYVKDILTSMKEQNTLPLYVSIGNEMNGGFLQPYGNSTDHMDNLARFINAGYRATKEVSEDIEVILHIGCNCDDMKWNGNGTGNWFFSRCKTYGVNYDVIGTSYYPFWAETLSVDDMTNWCNYMIEKFDKDVMIMETGFNYTKYTETGSEGQLYNMGIYEGVYEYTPEGQRDYMIELINGIKAVDSGRCLGFMYWDPIMVAGDGIGWSYKESTDKADNNVISNTTWFDFDHKALKVFDAFRYN